MRKTKTQRYHLNALLVFGEAETPPQSRREFGLGLQNLCLLHSMVSGCPW